MHLLAVVRTRSRLFLGVVLAVLLSTLLAQSAGAVSANLVISQVYGGGGNAGATYTHDFIELFNRGSAPIDLTGWSVQYGSSAGNIGPNAAQITPLSGIVGPGQYLLIREAQGAGGTTALPTPDVTDDTPIAMSATSGKVVLVNTTTGLNCGAPATPCTPAALAPVVDLVGYGAAANQFEGSGPTAGTANATAAIRKDGGCTETDNNAGDFEILAPTPRNMLSPTHECDGVGDVAPTIAAKTPDNGATGVALDSNITITFSEPVNVTGDWFAISCTASVSHPAAVTGGPTTFTLDPNSDFVGSETCSVVVIGAQVSDQDTNDPPDTLVGNPSWSFTTASPPVEIHQIQGANHSSPLVGTTVSVAPGVVTAKRSNGYYLQDPTPDADDNTSDAIFVFTSAAPTSVNVGDSVSVSGVVTEFRPGGATSTNLTITEIGSPTTTVLSSGNPLPPPTVLGVGGRMPPTAVIDNDSFAAFDPAEDGIDFYESLEATQVQINNAVVVGPRSGFGEIFVLGDNGANASVRTARGGIVIRDVGPEAPGDYASGDFNPERIQLDDAILLGSTPAANVGDHFSAPAVGIVDYDFGNFEVNLTSALTTVSGGLTRETTDAAGPNELAIATFNVENLDSNEPQSKFDAIAGQIVNNLRSPDILTLEEIQDNNGATNDTVVDASATFNKLIDSVVAAGGPTYAFRQINPVDDQDGGEPGGNIRVGFFFRPDRGVSFVDRPGGDATTPTTVVNGPDGPQLSFSPGRIDPNNTAWNASRKPIAGEFRYRGETFFAIGNHFNSKGGDNPLFGRFQPPVRVTEVQRRQQAQLVNDFVDAILAFDANANVAVLGDINDFEFSETMTLLTGGALHPLMSTLPQNERYSYVFEGNSQSLDHIVVSNSLFGRPFVFDPVHVNSEFHDQLSDHDPQVARFVVNSAPSVDAGGPYAVNEGGSVTLTATGTDPEGDALTYAWDLDNNGTFETPGQSVSYTAGDGPSAPTVRVQVSDGTTTAVDEATVNIANVAPTATFVAPASSFAGFPFTLSLTNPSDPSAADTAAGFQYAFDCGGGAGLGAFGASASVSCPTSNVGMRTVRGQIRDKDGGLTEYTATVTVVVTFDSLCSLVRDYSSKPSVSNVLCALLDAAERTRSPLARHVLLTAFRVLVVVSSGNKSQHAFTPVEGETLIRLSRAL